MSDQYTFGDSDLAAERLAVIAAVFAEPSRRLMVEAVPAHANVVLDLGCGPGHTTCMLAGACAPRRVVGVDASTRFVSLAPRLTDDPRVGFALRDVTRLPLPETPADALYARFLLSHLPDPLGLVGRWRSQLRPGGVLVLDELEHIAVPPGPLRAYEELAVAVVATGGGTLYAGEVLRPLGGRTVDVSVPRATAARMFRMNLDAWRPTAVAHGLADDDGLDALAKDLEDLGARADAATVRWVLRQLVVEA